MDPELLRTCQQGDVEKLRKLFDTRSHDHEFLLAQENEEKKNILHILFSPGKQVCAEEALSRLPIQVVRRLVCQSDIHSDNPIHLAAFCGFLNIVKLLVDAYKSSDDGADLPSPPWIAKNKGGKLPVQVAVAERKIDVAAFLLSVDHDFLRTVDNAVSLLVRATLNERVEPMQQSQEFEALRARLRTELKDIRNTLSIVAALLATITFAAAFTVPGGFDQNNGDILLGGKPAFIFFILSDTYAMCYSMIVLYTLVSAAFKEVEERDEALYLVAFSVILLHQSFYGTLGAFMAGVYTMLSSKSIWVAIIVLVTCSTVMIYAHMIHHHGLVFVRPIVELKHKLDKWMKATLYANR